MQDIKPKDFNNTWRRVAASVYKKPKDGRISGTVELDVTELEEYIQRQRQNGLKVTFTHFFLGALARGIREVAPEFNTYLLRGNILPRETIDAALSVLIEQDTQMSSVVIKKADEKSLKDLVELLTHELNKFKKGNESQTMRSKSLAAILPWPLRTWVVDALRVITMEWGIALPALGLNPHSFGSFVLTNIGSVGLDIGYPSLLPFSNVSAVVALGKVNTKPGIIEGKIVPRRMVQVSASIDHRLVDAQHIGLLFRFLKSAVKNPQQFE